ncbi:MAG: peroxiredoxin family protein [Anaerolineae bacterium]|nr:peroxiredoxin family protein [Anaerolineae bacterium]
MELRSNYEAFQNANAQVVALAVTSVEAVDSLKQGLGIPYPMLADADHRVSEDYGVYNLLGDGLAAPSVFIIDTDGQIVWSYVGKNASDRLSAEKILGNLP